MSQKDCYRRALVIRFGGMGDILLATPAVRALALAFPGIAIDFVVGAGMADALTGNPHIRQVWEFDKNGPAVRPRAFAGFLARLAGARYDLVLNLHPSAKSFLMSVATGARRHRTFTKHMEVRADTGRVAHAIDDFLKELRPLGIHAVADRRMEFAVPAAARARVDALLEEEGVRDENRLLVINPAATRPLNRWPAERFAAVAAHFAARPGVQVVLTGGSLGFDRELAARVCQSDPRILNLAGRLTVKELGALLLRADALLTCDTGPMHIGAALQTPLVVLSGAADPDRTGPLTLNATVLIDRALPCVPCRDRECRRGDVACMDNLSVPAVEAAVAERLQLTPFRARVPLAVW